MIPPTFAAANESTRTPNRSKRCLIPAIAPLNAKTKVPERSSIETTVRTGTAGILTQSAGKPGPCRNDQRFHPGPQRRLDYRREARIVVGRKLTQPSLRFRLRIECRVGPADEPEYRRRFPLRTVHPEVLARRRRFGFGDALGGKVEA